MAILWKNKHEIKSIYSGRFVIPYSVLLQWAVINLFAEKVNKIHGIEGAVLGSEFNLCSRVTAELPSPNRLIEIVLNFSFN
jgi:hypothetical protein